MNMILPKRSKMIKAAILCLKAIKIGILGGFSGVLYVGLVSIVFNLVFLGNIKINFNNTIHLPPSLWGIGIIIVPILGGLFAVWLLRRFAQNESGPSAPEIFHFIHKSEGQKRSPIEITKAFASIITIGTGGSTGQEIPIVQLGVTISYLFGRISHLIAEQRMVLLAAGGAASLSAAFSAPMTGLVFAVEILIFSFSISHMVLIGIASLTGWAIGHVFMNSNHLFKFKMLVQTDFILSLKYLILFLPFGIVLGIMASLFISGIKYFSALFNRFFTNPYLRHSIAMAIVGSMLYLLLHFHGHYYIENLGFPTIQDIFNLTLTSSSLLLLIFVCKLMSLCLTLSSGATGGIFAPSLFLGATLGAFIGVVLNQLFPSMQINQIYFVLGGMAGMLASVTGGVITAIIFTIEITKDYKIVLPILVTAISAMVTRLALCPMDVYTLKLFQHGLMFKPKL